ncbi:hypothetical protein VTN77DRAFT_8375 [Rasamsonia byssochlamydoides]|uniref:uncharacterized protein n=1 Tax=Rasamsonia byssochlamydoides TaxID=89139 RepID=UPI003742A554
MSPSSPAKKQPQHQQQTQKKVSITEALDLVPALLSISAAGILALVTGPFRHRKQRKNPKQRVARTLLLHVGYAILRKATLRLTMLQLQLIFPKTSTVYRLFAWRSGISNQTVELGYGAQGHWIGNREAKNVLVWYHGGGFAVPATRGYFQFLSSLPKTLAQAGKDLAVFVLSYTLTPHASYPTQLQQAVACLRYILQTGRAPANIYLGGDSAGGNLALGVLSHLSHPHAEIDELAVSEALGGAVLLAPWTDLRTEFPPSDIAPLGDLITQDVAKIWATAYLADRTRDFYTDASSAPAEWWHGLKVKEVLILAGENEILLPTIEEFAEKLKAALPSVNFFIGHGECHVAPMFNLLLGDRTETEQGKRLKSWLREVVV